MVKLSELKEILRDLISVHINFRERGIETLKNMINEIDPKFYSKVSYSLFYYYWYADGENQQTQGVENVIYLLNSLDQEKQQELFESILF